MSEQAAGTDAPAMKLVDGTPLTPQQFEAWMREKRAVWEAECAKSREAGERRQAQAEQEATIRLFCTAALQGLSTTWHSPSWPSQDALVQTACDLGEAMAREYTDRAEGRAETAARKDAQP